MKTIVRAQVEVWKLGIMLELAVWEKRPELQRLCKRASSEGRFDDAIVNTALPGLSASARRNVLRSLEHMRLAEGGRLTLFGRGCADTGEVPAWEQGCYSLLVARHPCFGAWPIAFEREKPAGQDRDFGDLREVPAWFQPTPKRSWTCAIGGQRFTLHDFLGPAGQPRLCRIQGQPAGRLSWELDLATGKNSYRVEGEIGFPQGPPLHFRTPDDSAPEAEVVALFAAWEPRWSQSTGRLLMSYDGVAGKDGRDDFIRTCSYKKVGAGARGTFDAAKVEGIPVGPAGAAEARSWATSLALSRVAAADGYVAPNRWTEQWAETIAGTPLAPQAGAAPDVSMLLQQQTVQSPRLRWLLAAASDLVIE